MGSRKFPGGLTAGAASVAVFISGCGAAGPAAPSALDPAKLAPASSVFYMSVTVRPQGAQRAGVEAALHKLFGARADLVIRQQVDKLLRKTGTTYAGGMQKWLGQRVGLVITQLSAASNTGVATDNVALIAPTTDPGDARAFIRSAEKRAHNGTTGGVFGHYAVYGGPAAVQAVKSVAGGGRSLAASSAFSSDTAALGGAEALAYVNLHDYLRALTALPQGALLGALLRQSQSRLAPGAALVMGLTASGRQISLDVDRYGVSSAPASRSVAPSVAGLPASSWLALAGGGSLASSQARKGFLLGFASGLSRFQGAAGGAMLGLIQQRLAFIENTVLPALGPLSLSISGTSPLALAAGLQMTPRDPAAAAHLLGMLRNLAAKSPSLQVTGSATSFSVQVPTGTRLNATERSGKVVVTYGFPDAAAFLHPSSTLAGTPLYRQAVAQLPAGSSVPLFLDFGPIASLVQLTDHSPSAGKTLRTLHELSYFIVGGHAGHTRLVLGLS